MDALVMAGGKGRRMGGEEKPMLRLKEKPLLSYVLNALLESRSIGRVYVAVSQKSPRTTAYVKGLMDDRISLVVTPGNGYVEDTAYAAMALGLSGPFLMVSADLPLITAGVIDQTISAYHKSGKEALSVRVDAAQSHEHDMVLTDTGRPTIPAGINIVHGAHMDRAQDEYVLVLNDPGLAMNVNYKKDLELCERLLK